MGFFLFGFELFGGCFLAFFCQLLTFEHLCYFVWVENHKLKIVAGVHRNWFEMLTVHVFCG